MGSGCSSFGDGSAPFDPKVISAQHFEIHRIVGQGGFGKVNAVLRKKATPAKWLAMKTLSKATVINRNCVSMIWNERNLLTQIRSPLIVRMHHTFQDPYSCYVVMDLLLGGDLKYHLGFTRKDGFPEREARFYTAGVLLSLEYLHGLRILHRDVKPENVILDDKGYPRLTDLGISVQTANLRFQSRSGTVAYMAPEIFRGSTEHGTPSDFFSLGVLAYELLLGRRPWNGGVRSQLEKCPNTIKEFSESAYDAYYPIELLESTSGSNAKLSQSCRSFLRGLLHPVEAERLGAGPDGILEIKTHEWLRTFDWDGYLAHTLAPPFVPVVDEKKANCDTAAQDFDDVLNVNSRGERISAEDQEKFVGFEFNVDAQNPVTR
ncbi:Serine/threonine-protein kinase 32A [Phytophthora pseudosyringae]|uniref:Serine/threonine-protein kinase 32A n=1 Tax=Phytophthora pseudosyringae TaxID=221518 RepID=A0A8T1VH47_9STRA|nr:Serine/threonine-protein kinase 32A [Phytophthora pseudosyringae]